MNVRTHQPSHRSLQFLLWILVLSASFYAHVSFAALLYFDPGEATVNRGDTITLSVRLDVDPGECINTVDAVVYYDDSIRAVDTSIGDSILNLWVESPKIDETNHTIRFAGGIPGGYCGRISGDPSLTNTILKLVFRSPGLTIGNSSDAEHPRIWFGDETRVLLHTGYGEDAPLVKQDATITLSQTPGNAPSDAWSTDIQNDNQPPADFVIELAKDEVAFDGKYFVTFTTTDKQSGIDHYEVMEEPFSEFYDFKWGRANAPWEHTESPYVIKDQSLNSTIRIKAVDKAGNERIETFVSEVAQRGMSQSMMILIGISVACVILLVGTVIYVLRKRAKSILRDDDHRTV